MLAAAPVLSRFDEMRAREYARLDRGGHVYLDYTGGGLHADSQVCEHMELLRTGVFGNPHSTNPTSMAATSLLERVRACVLDYFNAPPAEYVVVFTQNATSALKLVGESYPFCGGRFLLTYDNHNSVNGIREFARRSRAAIRYLPIAPPELRVDEERLHEELACASPGANNLFAFPAQSNFSGVQHPLEWIDLARAGGWDVLVDCAAFVPTNRLDLERWRPDYVALSFYKMFGYPTGLGCLLARREALSKLRRPWFAGGTVWGVSVTSDFHFLLEGGEAFEDGTVNYLDIPAIELGLRHISVRRRRGPRLRRRQPLHDVRGVPRRQQRVRVGAIHLLTMRGSRARTPCSSSTRPAAPKSPRRRWRSPSCRDRSRLSRIPSSWLPDC